MNADGQCVECASLYGDGCVKCDRTRCTEAKDGYVVMGVKAMECTDLFGDCNKCDMEGCTECESNLVAIGGYCRNCSILFGEYCTACSKNGCENCVEQPGISLVNGACVDCEQAYGKGCSKCSSETGCEDHMDGYFLTKRFSLPCEIFLEIPGNYYYLYEECISESVNPNTRRWIATRGDEEDQSTIVLDFNERNITVQCSDLTAECSRCRDDDGQAKCTKCNSGYLLVGWTCSPCSVQFPDGSCSECDSAGCTSCIEEGMNIANNGKCIKCRDGEQVFNTTTKTCVDCGTLFSRCSTCSEDKCLSCESDSFIYVEETGTCQTCSELYGIGCTECNSTHCIVCTDNDCCEDEQQQIIVMDGTAMCGTCSMLDENCVECTTEECTKCKDDSMFIEDGKCVKCSDRFDECGKCTADMCLSCTNPDSTKLILTYDGCYPNDTMEDVDEPSSPSPLSSSSSSSPSSSSSTSQPIIAPSSPASDGDGGSNAGMIAGIVIGCLVVVAIVGVAVYCIATNGAKHGKVSADIFEEDDNYVSMSVL